MSVAHILFIIVQIITAKSFANFSAHFLLQNFFVLHYASLFLFIHSYIHSHSFIFHLRPFLSKGKLHKNCISRCTAADRAQMEMESKTIFASQSSSVNFTHHLVLDAESVGFDLTFVFSVYFVPFQIEVIIFPHAKHKFNRIKQTLRRLPNQRQREKQRDKLK